MEKKDDESTIKKFINKSGNEVTVDTSKLATKQTIAKPDMTSALMVKQELVFELNEKIEELVDTINSLSDENTLMRDKIAVGQWNASEIEKIDIEETVANLREQIRILEIDNKALRDSRDMFQSRNAELMKTVKTLQKAKKG
jgi:hypothetical protein